MDSASFCVLMNKVERRNALGKVAGCMKLQRVDLQMFLAESTSGWGHFYLTSWTAVICVLSSACVLVSLTELLVVNILGASTAKTVTAEVCVQLHESLVGTNAVLVVEIAVVEIAVLLVKKAKPVELAVISVKAVSLAVLLVKVKSLAVSFVKTASLALLLA